MNLLITLLIVVVLFLITAYLIVKNTTFTGNTATSRLDDLAFDGGAISNYGTSSIYDSTFTDNFADLGGAISNWANSTVNVSGSTFKRTVRRYEW